MTDLCHSDTSAMLTLKEALANITASIQPIPDFHNVTLKQALGRITAEPISAPINLPPYRNSAMDGYALNSADIDFNNPFTLKLAGISWAGHPINGTCPPGHCVRVFTGALIPPGADSVVIQEQVSFAGDAIKFPAAIEAGQFVRNIGDDIRQGQQLIPAAKKLTAMDLGLLAAAGQYQIPVKRRLRIAVFSTGDELTAIGNALQPGQIYDSNRYSLYGLLQDNCHSVTDLGVFPDDKQPITRLLEETTHTYDAVISTGGASVGDADYIRQIVAEMGSVHYWKLAVKPGKPFAYGKIGRSYFFGLSGNPASVFASYHHLVLPALQLLSGMTAAKPLRLKARCIDNLRKAAGRIEFQRGIVSQRDNGELQVRSAGRQDSGILSSLSQANCYIVLPEHCRGMTAGEWVEVEPFHSFVTADSG